MYIILIKTLDFFHEFEFEIYKKTTMTQYSIHISGELWYHKEKETLHGIGEKQLLLRMNVYFKWYLIISMS